jgi:glutathione S-transferase
LTLSEVPQLLNLEAPIVGSPNLRSMGSHSFLYNPTQQRFVVGYLSEPTDHPPTPTDMSSSSSPLAHSSNATNSAPTGVHVAQRSNVVTLVYAPGSCSFGSIISLAWSGIPFKLVRFDFLSSERHENFLKISPIMQQAPQLVRTDGTPLAESSAILQHIARQNPSNRLWISLPEDNVDDFNFILSFLHTSFYSSFVPAWQAFRWYKPGSEASDALRDIARKQVVKALLTLEKRLSGSSEWLVGGRKTIADAYFAGIVRWNFPLKLIEDLPVQYPAVFKHFLKLEADDGVKFAHAIEDQTEHLPIENFHGSITFDDLKI